MSESIERVEALLKELGLADKTRRQSENVWTLQKGSATVQIVAAQEFVVATSRVLDRLPDDNREDFFRMLLSANARLLGAFFTLEADDSVRLNQVHPTERLDASELAFLVGNVAQKADDWDDKLQALIS